jgi:cyanate permease
MWFSSENSMKFNRNGTTEKSAVFTAHTWISLPSICMVPLIAAVSGWFRRRLGLATGILWSAGGLGAAGLAPLVSVLLNTLGWQGTFWSLGVIGGSIILSLTLLFRNRPADLGLTPYGANAADPPAVVRSPAVERLRRQVFTQQMRRTCAFWSLPLIHGLGCAGHGIVLLYAVPLAVERGLTLVAASVILSLISMCSIGSRLLTPIVAERWGGGQTDHRRGLGDPGLHGAGPVVGARGVDVLPLWQPLRHRLWRGDDGVPGGQPPVFRDGAHWHPVWL